MNKLISQPSSKLKHLAIIMDGNGRWAQKRGKKRTQGHKEGAKVVRDITQWCAQKHIPYLSLYAFSTENWSRPKFEVDFLMKLLEKYLYDERPLYIKNSIKFRVIGDISIFSERLKNAILELEHLTQNHTNLTQILALNYGSHDEISRTFIKVAQSISLQNLTKSCAKDITLLIEAHLDTATLPNVDMLVRTGGEKRMSNFLLWQSAYAELFFTNTLFPDFKTKELESMIAEFETRERRFGSTMN